MSPARIHRPSPQPVELQEDSGDSLVVRCAQAPGRQGASDVGVLVGTSRSERRRRQRRWRADGGSGPTWVLALETSTPLGGVALLEGTELRCRVVARMAGSHSRRLLSDIAAMLSNAGLSMEDVDLLVVSLGPGSFTGLRIGIATAKGLALASGAPLVGVSSLATMAAAASAREGLVAPALDARKRQVYSALYRIGEGRTEQILEESVEDPALWGQRTARAASGEPVLWIGAGAQLYRDQLLAPCAPGSRVGRALWDAPDPAFLALLGREKASGEPPGEWAALEPNYIRLSDAELARKRAERA